VADAANGSFTAAGKNASDPEALGELLRPLPAKTGVGASEPKPQPYLISNSRTDSFSRRSISAPAGKVLWDEALERHLRRPASVSVRDQRNSSGGDLGMKRPRARIVCH
jgi:hypothetical protein